MGSLILSGFNPQEVVYQLENNLLYFPGKLSDDLKKRIYPLTMSICDAELAKKGLRTIIADNGQLQMTAVVNNQAYLNQSLQIPGHCICWGCLVTRDQWLPADHDPWGLPLHRQTVVDVNHKIYYVFGIFCDPSCGRRFIKQRKSDNPQFWEQVDQYLLELVQESHPEISHIEMAPDYIMRDICLGPMDSQMMQKNIIQKIKWEPQPDVEIKVVPWFYLQFPK